MCLVRQAIEDAATCRTKNSRGSALIECSKKVLGGLVETAQRTADVAFQLCFGDAWLLEVQDIMKLALGHLFHKLGWLQRYPRQERGIDSNHPFDSVGRHQCRVPGDRAAPVM